MCLIILLVGPVPVPLRGTKEDQGPQHLSVDGLCKVSTISDIQGLASYIEIDLNNLQPLHVTH